MSPFRLEAGDHVFAIRSGAADTNYFLPVAWLSGEFAIEGNIVRHLPASVGTGPLWANGLRDYAGAITYSASVDVPDQEKLRLRVDTGGLFTSVSLMGRNLGPRAWAPFEWDVPGDCRGKNAELQISVWTSVAPMFGAYDEPASAWAKKFWVKPSEPRPPVGLLRQPQWLIGERARAERTPKPECRRIASGDRLRYNITASPRGGRSSEGPAPFGGGND